jgi:hypothetical protein
LATYFSMWRFTSISLEMSWRVTNKLKICWKLPTQKIYMLIIYSRYTVYRYLYAIYKLLGSTFIHLFPIKFNKAYHRQRAVKSPIISIFGFMCVFCGSLFVLLFFFFWPLRCLFFFDMRILITLWYLQALLVYYRNYFKSMV